MLARDRLTLGRTLPHPDEALGRLPAGGIVVVGLCLLLRPHPGAGVGPAAEEALDVAECPQDEIVHPAVEAEGTSEERIEDRADQGDAAGAGAEDVQL